MTREAGGDGQASCSSCPRIGLTGGYEPPMEMRPDQLPAATTTASASVCAPSIVTRTFDALRDTLWTLVACSIEAPRVSAAVASARIKPRTPT
jgi:hypothetical protein